MEQENLNNPQSANSDLGAVSDCSCGYDPDDWCEKCGSSAYYEDCWSCGGEGGTDGEELMMEDPLWYSPDDFRTCDICEGKGTFKMCLNHKCGGE